MGDTVHGDKYGGDRIHGDKIVLHATGGGTRPGSRREVILLMSANPDPAQLLRLDEERREIDRAVALAQAGDRLEVRKADALRLDDLQSALLTHRPAVAHFSGHGSTADGILVSDGFGGARPVPPAALSDLFRILRDGLRCVVLNACFTQEQARAIAAHVPCVVGMRSSVFDETAIRFAAGFYQGIAHGRSIRVSFELGCNGLDLHERPDAHVPCLLATGEGADQAIIRGR